MKSVDLTAEVAALGDLTREELVARWQRDFGCPPPSGVRRNLLIKATAWHFQVKRLGGLSPAAARLLRLAVSEAEHNLLSKVSNSAPAAAGKRPGSDSGKEGGQQRQPTKRKELQPGARLMRTWNGRTYVVDVLEEGFAFEGKVHRSLSVIARQITGTHWSGPRFFGL